MTFLRNAVSRSTAAMLAATAALSTPAFAEDALSSLRMPSMHSALASMTPRDMLLYGSIALLVVAIALRAVRDTRDDTPIGDGPDLRWWKNQ